MRVNLEARYTKKSLIRCDENCCPIGTAGHMHLNCVCGERLELGRGEESNFTCPKCGTEYTPGGWIVGTPKQALACNAVERLG